MVRNSLFASLLLVGLGQTSPPPKPFVMQLPCLVSETDAQRMLQVFADQHAADFPTFEKLAIWKGRGATGTFQGFFYLLGPAGAQHFYFQPLDQSEEITLWEGRDGASPLPNISLGSPIKLRLWNPPKRPRKFESVPDPLSGEAYIRLRHQPGDPIHTLTIRGLN